MTLTEFNEKWEDKNLPIEVSHPLGACIAMLENAGLSKEEIKELVGDIIDLAKSPFEQVLAEAESMTLSKDDVH